MDDIKPIKEKLKKIANTWAEIKSLSSDAIYDINDSSVNWDKTITYEEAENIIKQKVKINTPRPTAKIIVKPKEPSKISVTGIVLLILMSICALICSFNVFYVNEISYIFSYIIFIIGLVFLIAGTTLLILYFNQTKYAKLKNLNLPNIIAKILGVLFTVIGGLVAIVMFFIAIGCIIYAFANPDRFFDILDLPSFYLGIISSVILWSAIALIIDKYASYNYKTIIYKKNLNIMTENINYNNNQLSKEVEEYENLLKSLYEKELNKINLAHKKISKNFAKIEEIDIISSSQAKYAQELLEYIYKGATSIKEAFEEIEKHKSDTHNQTNNL